MHISNTHAMSLILSKSALEEVSYLSQCLPAELMKAFVSCAQDGAAPLVSVVAPVTTHFEDPKAAHPRWGAFSDADPG